MLFKLLSLLDRSKFVPNVISLTDIGSIGRRIRELDVSVRALNMQAGVLNPLCVLRLASWFRRDECDLVQTWMYHADLVGGIAARLAGRRNVVWGIRQSNLDPRLSKRSTLWTMRICAQMSRWIPNKVVCCAEAAQKVHVNLGYARDKMVLIPNGFDTDLFKPCNASRTRVRQELDIAEEDVVIGLVARFDAQKDHHTFVRAAGLLCERFNHTRFVLCGSGVGWDNSTLVQWLDEAGLRGRFRLLGPRDDMAQVTASFDIASSSSAFGEGFANAIGEAMACGVCFVATDVGDARRIVGDTGWIVPTRDPRALADAWSDAIRLGGDRRRRRGEMARRRIETDFSLDAVVGQYQQLYEDMLA